MESVASCVDVGVAADFSGIVPPHSVHGFVARPRADDDLSAYLKVRRFFGSASFTAELLQEKSKKKTAFYSRTFLS